MIRNAEQINLALALCIQDLRNIAKADGVVTEDEKAILDEIEKNFVNMEDQLIQILESDLDTHEFNDLINDFLLDIVERAVKVAKRDNIVTEDESNLLDKLQEFIDKEGHFNE